MSNPLGEDVNIGVAIYFAGLIVKKQPQLKEDVKNRKHLLDQAKRDEAKAIQALEDNRLQLTHFARTSLLDRHITIIEATSFARADTSIPGPILLFEPAAVDLHGCTGVIMSAGDTGEHFQNIAFGVVVRILTAPNAKLVDQWFSIGGIDIKIEVGEHYRRT